MEKSDFKWEELENKAMDISEENKSENKENSTDLKIESEKEKYKKIKRRKIIAITVISSVIIIVGIISTIFALINIKNDNIVSGVKIEGIDVSGLSRDEAKSNLEIVYNEKRQKDILLKYEDYDATINPELLDTNYEID